MPVSYRHIIYIHFPYLAASRIQRASGQRASGANLPLVIIRKINGADIIVAGCTKAAAHALAAGMRLADARALCPQLKTETYDPLADHADLHHLAYGRVVIAHLPQLMISIAESGLILLVPNICLAGCVRY